MPLLSWTHTAVSNRRSVISLLSRLALMADQIVESNVIKPDACRSQALHMDCKLLERLARADRRSTRWLATLESKSAIVKVDEAI